MKVGVGLLHFVDQGLQHGVGVWVVVVCQLGVVGGGVVGGGTCCSEAVRWMAVASSLRKTSWQTFAEAADLRLLKRLRLYICAGEKAPGPEWKESGLETAVVAAGGRSAAKGRRGAPAGRRAAPCRLSAPSSRCGCCPPRLWTSRRTPPRLGCARQW